MLESVEVINIPKHDKITDISNLIELNKNDKDIKIAELTFEN